jgi:hypothetical protein
MFSWTMYLLANQDKLMMLFIYIDAVSYKGTSSFDVGGF